MKLIKMRKLNPKTALIIFLCLLLIGATLLLARHPIQTALFNLTGEEALLPQLSGLVQYGLTRLQPPLQTAADVPVQYTGLNPYGVNTFLQNEVEPAKREKAMRLISEAGLRWIRQEFPWEDIEIHGKGDFEDRRHKPYKSAWEKYDQIVALAEKYDLNIMARLSNPPAWSRAMTDTVGVFAPPDDLTDYGDFVEAVANRYRGRIAAYQIWNEPNIYPEWGEYPISAEAYTALLKEGYSRVKAADPEAIVVMGALAATIEVDRARRYDPNGRPVSPGGLSDALFLQQMYNAGAGPYFDVLAMQGYGLWSGPTDQRMQPRVLNFSRPLYIRDIMARNGDAHKPIWLSELGWNALPPESGLPPVYGRVTPEQQGRYAVLAYERMQREWPWLGVGFYWFFKQADDRERETSPQYYFRMVEPDFSPLPVYEALKQQTRRAPAVYPGWHQAHHWAVMYQGSWRPGRRPEATFGDVWSSSRAGDTATFTFEGSALSIAAINTGGLISVRVDQAAPLEIELKGASRPATPIVNRLAPGLHQVRLEVIKPPVSLDGYIVENRPSLALNRAGSVIMVLAALGGLWAIWRRRREGRPGPGP
jgi:hypothetical protein